MYSTKWGQGIASILSAYQPGPMQIAALEKLATTVEESAKARYRDEVAQTVCEGMHPPPAGGLKCRLCYQAEVGFSMLNVVETEIQAAQQRRAAGEPEVFEVEPLPE